MWLDSNLELATLLMSEQDMRSVMMAKGDWKAVAMHVARLVASSSLGQGAVRLRRTAGLLGHLPG